MLAGCDERLQKDASEYRRHLGLAFQVVDDMLDYVATSEILGKPAAADKLLTWVSNLSGIVCHGDVKKALKIVIGSRGLEQTKELAKEHCYAAASLAEKLPSKDSSRDCLIDYALAQLSRDK
uniref:Uncharacterized protein n=1 Tax=Panagrolaimus davidi TaxID=227884 RepID=A0A914QF66_9BILA